MAKIYISSTFKDLQPQRQAALHALQELRHDVRGMESYVASGHRPVSVCLRDVEWCDFYVGIFAWRYGYVPEDDNPQRLSITELEYRRALAQGKECLIFLLNEQTPWVREWDDSVTKENGAGAQIERLRKDLQARHTVSRFSTTDELGRLVNASVELALRQRLAADLERERSERADESARQCRGDGRRVVGARTPDAGALFRGRTEQRQELSRLIAEGGNRIISVLGRAGIGKTALVARVLAEIEQGRWPHQTDAGAVDGFIYLSSRSASLSLESIFQSCALMLGGERKTQLIQTWQDTGLSTEQKVDQLLQALEGGLYVIFMDHIDLLLDEHLQITDPQLAAFFQQALATERASRLVVTCREPVTMAPALMRFDRQIVLGEGLPLAEGCAFLRDLDANNSLGFRELDDETLGRAVTALHGIPRALELLVTLRQRNLLGSLDEMLQGFYASEDVLNELIRESFRTLDDSETLVMHALAVLGRPVKRHEVEFLIAPFAPGLAVDTILTALIQSRMIRFERGAGMFSLDEIERDYCFGQLAREGGGRRVELERRAAAYYRTLRVAPERWRSQVDFEPHLAECEHLVRAGDHPEAAEVLAVMDLEFLALTGEIDRVRAIQAALEDKVSDPRVRAIFLLGLGQMQCFLGPLEEALTHLTSARGQAAALGDAELERRATGCMGEAERRLGHLDQAIEHLGQACAIYETDEVALRDRFPLVLSLAYSYRSESARAIWWGERIRQLAARFGQLESQEGYAEDALALACIVASDYAGAIAHAKRAIACYQGLQANDPIAYVLNVWGLALMGNGAIDEAIARFAEAREDAHRHAILRAEGIAAFNQAQALLLRGRPAEAAEAARAAGAVLGKIGAGEAAAAAALERGIQAAADGDVARELQALLEAMRASLTNSDLLSSPDLLATVENRARQANLPPLAEEAAALRRRLRQ